MKKRFIRFMVSIIIIIIVFIIYKGNLELLYIDGIDNYSSKYIYVMNRENKNIEYEKKGRSS